MSTLDLILISITIPMTAMIIVLSMLNHEYKKTLRRPSKKSLNVSE
jgi:hypothetical protein